MPKNRKLHDAICGLRDKKESEISRPAEIKALEDLLKVDYTEANDDDRDAQFRQAVVDNEGVWNKFDDLMKCERQKNTGSYWSPNRVDDLDYFKEDEFLDPNVAEDEDYTFLELQQQATEELVKFGLKNDSPEDKEVLLNILKYNTEECRAYLAEKNPILKQIHGWQASTLIPAPKPDGFTHTNGSDTTLTEESIDSIKEYAAQLILMKLLKNVPQNKSAVLIELIQAIDDQDKDNFIAKAKLLDYPDKPHSIATLSSIFDENEDLTSEIRKAAEDRVKEFKHTVAEARLKQISDNLDNAWLLSQKTLLNKASSTDFLTDLLANPKFTGQVVGADIKPDAKSEIGAGIQKKLCEKYLPVMLEKDGITDLNELRAALNATNPGQLVTALNNDIADHDQIITHGVTQENMASLQVALVKNYIQKMGQDQNNLNHLDALGKAGDLQDFKTNLARVMGAAAVDFIKDSDLGDLKKEIFIQHFQLRINDSRLGKKAHSELIKVFNALPLTNQKKLVENPKILPLIINSSDPDVLKHYLGREANVAELAKENQRNAAFKQIHNHAISKALADYDPLLSLTPMQIQAINIEISRARVANHDLLIFPHYKLLIDQIKNQCGRSGPQEDVFYEAFNIVGNAFSALHPIADNIARQHNYNKVLHADVTLNKKLLDVLLRVEKTQEFDAVAIRNIKTKFEDSKDIEEFFKKWPKDPNAPLSPDEKSLKSAFMKELTPALFHEIKTEENKQKFLSATTTKQNEIIADTKTALKAITEFNDTLIGFHNQSLIHLRGLEESHTLGLTGEPRDEIFKKRDQYKDLKEDCINIVSKLEDNLRKIEALKLPVLPSTSANEKAAEALNKELEAEKKVIKQGIKTYTELAEKMAKRQREIEAILDSQLIHTPKGLKIYRQDRTKAGTMGETVLDTDTTRMISNRKVDTRTAIASSGEDNELFKRTGKPGDHEVICFDSSVTLTGRVNIADEGQPPNYQARSYEINGRFTYDQKSEKLEIIQFPKDTRGELSPQDLAQQRADFAMNMVMQELMKRLDNNNPPTQDNPIVLIGIKQRPDEVRYLHAACMAFGISPDAILVKGNAGFNPESEIDRKMFNRTSPKEGSLYNQVFKPKEQDIKTNYVDQYNKKVEEKNAAKKAIEPVDNKIKQLEKKQEFQDLRAKWKEREQANRDREVPEEISADVAKLSIS